MLRAKENSNETPNFCYSIDRQLRPIWQQKLAISLNVCMLFSSKLFYYPTSTQQKRVW